MFKEIYERYNESKGSAIGEQMTRSNPLDLEQSFDKLYRENLRALFQYLFSRVQDIHLAEDLSSETFISAFESLNRLKSADKFKPWLFTIARNKANDHFRRLKRQPTLELDEEIAALPLQEQAGNNNQDQRVLVQQLFARLKPAEQELLRLKLVASLTFKEIAILLKSNENNVKKSYYRLLERLQAQVE